MCPGFKSRLRRDNGIPVRSVGAVLNANTCRIEVGIGRLPAKPDFARLPWYSYGFKQANDRRSRVQFERYVGLLARGRILCLPTRLALKHQLEAIGSFTGQSRRERRFATH